MKKIYFFCTFLWCGLIFPQISVQKDSGFGNQGSFSTSFPTENGLDFKSNLIVLADFSLLQTVCFSEGSYLIKLKPDGNPDLNFAENGVLNLESNNYINAVLQGEKIIVYSGPKFPDFADYADSKIVRYNNNGTLDTSFGSNGVLDIVTESTHCQSLSVLVLNDKSFIVDSGSSYGLKKFTENGQPILNFGNSGELNYAYHFPLGIFPNGKIVTYDLNSTSSEFSFFDLNNPTNSKLLDFKMESCGQNSGSSSQFYVNSARISNDGTIFSTIQFPYTNNLAERSRLVVSNYEVINQNFNGEGYLNAPSEELFLDAGFSANSFIVLTEKKDAKKLYAVSKAGKYLSINNIDSFSLQSGNEIETSGSSVFVSSVFATDGKINLKIEKLNVKNSNEAVSQKKVAVNNPFSDEINIKSDDFAQAEIFEISGKRLISSQLQNINTAYLPKGNYLLKVSLKNGSSVCKKIMKL